MEREGERRGNSTCHPLPPEAPEDTVIASGLLFSAVQNNAHQSGQCVPAPRCCHPSLWNKQRKCIRRPRQQMESTSPSSTYAVRSSRWKPISMSIVFQGPLPPTLESLRRNIPLVSADTKGCCGLEDVIGLPVPRQQPSSGVSQELLIVPEEAWLLWVGSHGIQFRWK